MQILVLYLYAKCHISFISRIPINQYTEKIMYVHCNILQRKYM
jgi:hypothetical protein